MYDTEELSFIGLFLLGLLFAPLTRVFDLFRWPLSMYNYLVYCLLSLNFSEIAGPFLLALAR